jgi:hypothetical protein
MRILGIDQSLTRTGWAVVEGHSSVELTGWFKSANTADFGDQLRSVLLDTQPDMVVAEQPVMWVKVYRKQSWAGDGMAPSSKQLVLPWIAGMIEMGCLMAGISFQLVPVATWRAGVIGKGAGRLPRAEAKAAAKTTCDRLGIKYANEDVAEAILIALWGVTSPAARMLAYGAERQGS